MKLPRDISGEELAGLLSKLGYRITRQTGSHLRLSRQDGQEHNITIPKHGSLKIGTLNSILKDIAGNLKMSKENLAQQLWGGRE